MAPWLQETSVTENYPPANHRAPIISLNQSEAKGRKICNKPASARTGTNGEIEGDFHLNQINCIENKTFREQQSLHCLVIFS